MLKKIFITLGCFLVILYGLFLLLPFCLSGLINSYDFSKIIEDACGYKVKFEKVALITTPKLNAGIGVKHADVALPNGDSLLSADNIKLKLSLISLIFKQIKFDVISAENINLNLKVKKDGHFLIEDYIVEEKISSEQITENSEMFSLPYGMKLSNHLPDINFKNYNISFVDLQTDKSYSIFGDKFLINDFIFNKKIKINTIGKVQLDDKEQFAYDFRLLNKIMPNIDINDLVMNTQQSETQSESSVNVNIIDIFKAIYKNQLTASLKSNIILQGSLDDIDMNGYINLSNFSVAVDGKKLPDGNADLTLKGNTIKLYTKLYTAEKEITEILGNFKTGKHPFIDVNCKSNAQFKSLFDLIDSVAKSVDYKQFDTLTATGGIDADFTIKSNLKKIESSGYLKIPSASIVYKLYNIVLDKIFADIQFANNTVDIKDSGFTIIGQPLKVKGVIDSEANADLTVVANNLQLKGLFLALGQMSLLKENVVNSGAVSLNVLLKGKLDKIIPKIDLSINNVNLKNIPSNTTVALYDSKANIIANGKSVQGDIEINNAKIINPIVTISAPKAQILLGEKDINISNSYLLFNNSRIDVSGIVSDYISKNINIDIKAKGNIQALDIKSIIPKEYWSEIEARGSLPLNIRLTGNDKAQDINFDISSNPSNYLSFFSIENLKGKNTLVKGDIKINGDVLKLGNNTGVYANGTGVAYLKGYVNDLYKSQALNLSLNTPSNISMAVPFVKNSKIMAGGNINIVGSVLNPILKGDVSIPIISIPDMLLKMSDLKVSLNGPIVKGKGTLKDFVCGGIVANNLTSDFNLVNNVFYLKNLNGDAFNGNVLGDISYNIINGNIGVNIKGSGMDAESAIAGAAGLKNALSGKLNFTTNVTTKGETDVQLIKNLKGNASFDISDGELGNIGRFDNFLLAQNLMTNPVIKAGVNSVRTLPIIRNTAKFKTLKGNLTFSDGWANLSPIKMSGQTMSYYITGKYNILNATANAVVLGRMSAEVVKLLGPLGELSLSKLTSLIPGVVNSTVALIRAITTNPYGEKISEIPPLSSGDNNYKDFKVQFNGGVESSSSVKTFRWLSVCDTSEIESLKIKDQIQAAKQAVQEAKQQQIDNYTKYMEAQRKQAQEDSQQMKDAVEGLKNLFKSSSKSSSPAQDTTSSEAVQETVKPETTLENE